MDAGNVLLSKLGAISLTHPGSACSLRYSALLSTFALQIPLLTVSNPSSFSHNQIVPFFISLFILY